MILCLSIFFRHPSLSFYGRDVFITNSQKIRNSFNLVDKHRSLYESPYYRVGYLFIWNVLGSSVNDCTHTLGVLKVQWGTRPLFLFVIILHLEPKWVGPSPSFRRRLAVFFGSLSSPVLYVRLRSLEVNFRSFEVIHKTWLSLSVQD